MKFVPAKLELSQQENRVLKEVAELMDKIYETIRDVSDFENMACYAERASDNIYSFLNCYDSLLNEKEVEDE